METAIKGDPDASSVAVKKSYTDPNAISRSANVVLNGVFIIYSVLCVFPVMLVLAVSFTDEKTVAVEGYRLIPGKFSLAAYEFVFNDFGKVLRSYEISIVVTVVGTLLGLFITSLFAYSLARHNFSYRGFFSFFIFFTMIFNGGLVPWYLVYTNYLHFNDSLLALIVPGHLLSAFYVIMMRTFFQQTIHPSIMESASIDGASEYRIYFTIVLPLSMPVIATIGLFYTLGYWNDWFNSLVFMNNDKMVNLQYLMYKVMRNLQFLLSNAGNSSSTAGEIAKLPNETVRMAMAMIGMGPIVLAYPFFQKYFVKGLTVGAIKG
ncbi:MAG: carbohydrate transporter permease [Paenibacillaceae bacterium]|jgi:putative aldouronate transport system permease protein|nr:carbohydrate transporter permease [Paenibacillaceae bacterium]